MNVKLSTLENGLRVVTQSMDHLETVSLGLWVGAGSRFESDNEHGIAHLLEHMAFKGTKSRSARDIAEEIEYVGGDINAATSAETTAYYARTMKQDLPLGLELIGDILINPTFDSDELEREKNVIIQEISAANDSPDDVIYDLAQQYAFPNQALGRSILGTAESVMSFAADDLRAFRDSRYGAGSMVFSASGALDHDEVVARAGERFGALKSHAAPAAQKAVYQGGFCQSSLRFEQGHLLLAYEGPSYTDGSYYATQVLSAILGGGMSSRLFQEAREARGLCYAIYSFCWGVNDTGMFGVHAATAPDQYDALLDVITFELRRAVEEPPSEDELTRAKAQLKAGLMLCLESSGARAEQLARQTLAFGAPLAVAEMVAKVEAVSAEAVQLAAKKVFDGRSPTLANVGPRDLNVNGQAWVRRLGAETGLAAE
jgi:predicted Zn-dependent peptidase